MSLHTVNTELNVARWQQHTAQSPVCLHSSSLRLDISTSLAQSANPRLDPQGPKYSLQVNGGVCEILDNGSVECKNPSIVLKGTPLTCNLPYRAAAELEVGVTAGCSD
jgi:hypothetical protein